MIIADEMTVLTKAEWDELMSIVVREVYFDAFGSCLACGNHTGRDGNPMLNFYGMVICKECLVLMQQIRYPSPHEFNEGTIEGKYYPLKSRKEFNDETS